MLIPKETFTFLGLTGYGEQMLKEFRNALLEGKEGGLIGKILDNADGLSCNVYNIRQRLERSCDCSPSDLLSKRTGSSHDSFSHFEKSDHSADMGRAKSPFPPDRTSLPA